jgi:hypothetical protein
MKIPISNALWSNRHFQGFLKAGGLMAGMGALMFGKAAAANLTPLDGGLIIGTVGGAAFGFLPLKMAAKRNMSGWWYVAVGAIIGLLFGLLIPAILAGVICLGLALFKPIRK